SATPQPRALARCDEEVVGLGLHPVHALLTETELARDYATVEALLAHPQIRSFVDWVKTKPDDFFVATRKSARLRRR
ncbi:MAG TPA: hypothetical protein VIN03_12195, partial [Roseateles sp.]